MIVSKINAGRDTRNWLLYSLYTRKEFSECLKVIDSELAHWNQQLEYPLYVKGLIYRQQGKIQESLELFQRAAVLNPSNHFNLKQVGRSLYVLVVSSRFAF
jgi:Bardet-Biedl syndrome 4 protein